MKTKLTALLALLLGAVATLRAETQPPITVAVCLFDSALKVIRRNVTSLVTAQLSTDSRFALVERAELQKILGEEALGVSGIVSPESAAKIGRLTGARVLVTGRVFKNKSNGELVLAANIIGTETGRVFAETEHGALTNQVALAEHLAGKIAQVISAQATNFLASTAELRERRISRIVAGIRGRERPTVSIQISENFQGVTNSAPGAVETELGLILQQADFTVLDEKSRRQPDVLVTGSATAADSVKHGELFSCRATVEAKAVARDSGKILLLDRQQSVAVDLGGSVAAKKALETATDELAERLLPSLAK